MPKKKKLPKRRKRDVLEERVFEPSLGKKKVLSLVLLVLSVFLAYSSSFKGTWIMDDFLANQALSIHDFSNLLGFRKIAYATFRLNDLLDLSSPAGYRFVNVVIHICNSVLVYILTYKTMVLLSRNKLPAGKKIQQGTGLFQLTMNQAFFTAALSSVIFALHPININAVAYIIQRMASLSTLFVLLALLSYVAAWQSGNRLKAVSFYVVSSMCVILGIFSKENAVMAIPLILLYDYVFLSRFNINVREFIAKLSIVTAMGTFCIGVATFFLHLNIATGELAGFFLQPFEPLSRKGWMAMNVSWTPLQHILTEFRVLARYLFLLLLPLPQFLVFDGFGYPVSRGFMEPLTTLFSMMLVTSLILFAVVKLKRYPLVCFGLLWYFIAISLESFFSLGSDLYFEHRNYLPFAGLILGITGHCMTLDRFRMKDRGLWMTVITVCLIFSVLTFSRNFVWKDSVTLWGDTIKKNPFNYRAHSNLGVAYESQDRIDKAIEHYKIAIELNREYIFAYYNLGNAYQSQGLTDRAIENYKTVVQLNPRMPEAHSNLGIAYKQKGLLDEAEQHLKIATELRPDEPSFHMNLGNIFLSQGLIDRAIDHYKIVLQLNPAIPEAHYNLGNVYKSQGNLYKAMEHYTAAIQQKRDFIKAHINLGNILLSQGLPDKAIKHYKAVIQLKPDIPEAHINIAFAYKSQGFIDKARAHLRIARDLKPSLVEK